MNILGSRVFHVSSYPRSGSHLLRAALEYSYMRPTIGCPSNSEDIPIYERQPNQEKKVITISDYTPIAVKSHFMHEMKRHQSQYNCRGLIFIVREPVDAITSHVCRMRTRAPKSLLSKFQLLLEINKQIRRYKEAINIFESFDSRCRYVINFGKISGNEREFLNEVYELYNFIGKPIRPIEPGESQVLRELSRESQGTIGKPDAEFKEWVAGVLQDKISYADVERVLKR